MGRVGGGSARYGRGLLHAAVVVAIVLLDACANYPSSIAPGMSYAEVLAHYGRPSIERPTPDGKLLIYATGPMGQYAYGAVIDSSDHVTEVAQVLSPENFARIRKGEWDEEEVLQNFGPPAARRSIRGNVVWDYRYKEYDTYNSLFSITFNQEGLVEKSENGPDWMWDGGRNGRAK